MSQKVSAGKRTYRRVTQVWGITRETFCKPTEALGIVDRSHRSSLQGFGSFRSQQKFMLP